MKLKDYLSLPDSLSVRELTAEAGIKSEAQVRQWQHGYAERLPSPKSAVAIERATGGRVRRWDLRPEDWNLIWPELIGAEGAPAVPESAQEARDAA